MNDCLSAPPRPVAALCRLLPVLVAVALPLPAGAGTPVEAIGEQMGYRIFGEARKNRPILLQNSRPHPVQVFEGGRGVFIEVPPYSDRDLPCKGTARVLNVRFRDNFGEQIPFQVRIACGRELQFIAPTQVAPPRPVPRPELAPPVEPGALPGAVPGAVPGALPGAEPAADSAP